METDPKEEKIDRLFAAARRAEPYKKEIEYGFETRLMSNIRGKGERQLLFLVWAWRLIPAFVSIVIVLGVWTYESRYSHMTDLTAIASVGNEETATLAFLTGE